MTLKGWARRRAPSRAPCGCVCWLLSRMRGELPRGISEPRRPPAGAAQAGAAHSHGVRKAAKKQAQIWADHQTRAVQELRHVERRRAAHAKLLLQRSAANVMRAALVKHETGSIFLAPVATGMRRWQKCFMVVTIMYVMLTIDVWLFYSKSLNCCLEVRAFLGCSPSYLEPCREFAGDCADLVDQFKYVPDSGIPDDYECTAFPDDKSARDKLIVGLICFAVGLPFTLMLEDQYATSNEPAFPELQLSYPLPLRLLYGKPSWAFDNNRPSLFKLVAMRFAHEPKKIVIELAAIAQERAAEAASRAASAARAQAAALKALLVSRWSHGTSSTTPPPPESGDKAAAGSAGGALRAVGALLLFRKSSCVCVEPEMPPQTYAKETLQHGREAAPVVVSVEQQGNQAPPAGGAGVPVTRRRSSGASGLLVNGGGVPVTRRRSSAGQTDNEHAVLHDCASSSASCGSGDLLRDGITQARRQYRQRLFALACTYGAWGLFTWMVFVYGRLIYTLRGAKSESAYVQSWGIALGMEQGAGFQDVLTEACKAALIAMLLEPHVVPAHTWFEEHVDFLSVHATVARQAAKTRWGRLVVAIRHYAYHVSG